MPRMKKRLKLLLMSSILILPMLTTACAEHRRGIYDPYRQDYHRWDNNEDVYYRRWLGEKHWEYRKFNRLQRNQQEEYWRWRHDHQ